MIDNTIQVQQITRNYTTIEIKKCNNGEKDNEFTSAWIKWTMYDIYSEHVVYD